LANDEKDRHVLAAAVSCKAPIIVTFNVRHFRREHLGSGSPASGVISQRPL
jgi:predicted nucleic acid-binding protein